MPRACNRALVEEQQLAVAIGGGWSEGFDPNVFVHAGDAAGGRLDLEALRGGARCRARRDCVAEGVTEAELRRAKNMAAADFWRGVSTIDGKARLLGEYAVMHGDHRLLFAAPEAYERVTLRGAWPRRLRAQVFSRRRRTVGALVPCAGDES